MELVRIAPVSRMVSCFSLRCFSLHNGGVKNFVGAEQPRLAAAPEPSLPSPFPFIPADTNHAACVILGFCGIMAVLSRRNIPQIDNAVVVPFAVYVVYLAFRPFTVVDCPNYTVCHVFSVKNRARQIPAWFFGFERGGSCETLIPDRTGYITRTAASFEVIRLPLLPH